MTEPAGLQMKYFVLKPAGNSGDEYARASRAAMQSYAEVIQSVNPALATDLMKWAEAEARKSYGYPPIDE